MRLCALSLCTLSLFFACRSTTQPHQSPASPMVAPPASAAAVGNVHYFDLAPTQTLFDATKLQSVDYTLSAVQQGTQTGIHISIATPLDPNSDFFRLSICTDSSCSDPQRVQQEFAPAIWDYYPAPSQQGVLTVQLQACIDPARAKDPAVTCGPIQTKVWKQVANPDDAAAASMQTFQAERNGFQSDCEQARTFVNTYLQANPMPPTAPEALRFYNLVKNFSFLDPHTCASLIRSGELWTIDASLQQNATTPTASQGLGLADSSEAVTTQDILVLSAIAASTISILCFVGALATWKTERNSGNIKSESMGNLELRNRITAKVTTLGNIDAIVLKTIIKETLTNLINKNVTFDAMKEEIYLGEERATKTIKENLTKQNNLLKEINKAIADFGESPKLTEAKNKAKDEIIEQNTKMEGIIDRMKEIKTIQNVKNLVKYQLTSSLQDAISTANSSTSTVLKAVKIEQVNELNLFKGEILQQIDALPESAPANEVKSKLETKQNDIKKILQDLNISYGNSNVSNKQKIATTSNEKLPTGSNKGAIAGTVFGVVFAVAAVVLGVLSTQQLATDTATTSQQALLDQFKTLRTQIDARMDRYLAAHVQ